MKIVNQMSFDQIQRVIDRFRQEVAYLSLAEWLSYKFDEMISKTILGCAALFSFVDICLFFIAPSKVHVAAAFCLGGILLVLFLWFFDMIVNFMHARKTAVHLMGQLEKTDDQVLLFIQNFDQFCILDHYLLERMCNFELSELEQTVIYYKKALDIANSSIQMFHVFDDDGGTAIVFALSSQNNSEFHRMLKITSVETKFDITEPELHLLDAACILVMPDNGRLFK